MKKRFNILIMVCMLIAVSLFNPVTARAEIASGTCGTCVWNISDDGTLTISPANGTSGTLGSYNYSGWPWYSKRNKVKKVVIEEGTAANTKTTGMFYGMYYCTDIQAGGLDTSNVTDMSEMFNNCSALANISGHAEWDTSNVTNMYNMFNGCKSLVDTSGLADWDTGNVTSMGSMFGNCGSLADTSGLAGWDTGSVTNMSGMFRGCASLTGTSDFADWNTGKVTNMNSMFGSCKSLSDISDLARWNKGNVQSMQYMFSDCTSLSDTSGFADWDTGSVTDMSGMFYGCTSLSDTSGFADWDTGKVTSMSQMFYGCTSLSDTSGFADWDTGKVTNMGSMFYGCASLADMSGLADWNTGSATDMSSMFYDCTSLADTSGLANWNTGNVTNVGSMFSGCSSLADISGLANWNTSKVTNMSSMFDLCKSLLDVSALADWDTGEVKFMNRMFSSCLSLTDISGLSNWNTSKVTDMKNMFNGTSITSTSALADWNTGNVTDMSYIFRGCKSLTDASGLANWDTSKVTTMSYMFNGCESLEELDMGRWDTSSVSSFSDMFSRYSNPKRVNLGENVKFDGNGISYNGGKLTLPTPWQTVDGVNYTSKWIKEDETYGPYTSNQLRDNYTPDMAGWWVWQANSSNGVVWFNPNGGHTTAGQVSSNNTSASVTMPDKTTTTRLGYTLAGWNTKADGTGTTYQPGETYNDVFEMGKNKPLYAMWEETDLRPYRVKVYMQKSSLNGYDLYSDEVLEADKNTEVTYTPEDHDGFMTPDPVTATVSEDGKTVIKVYYDRVTYTVSFDRNGAEFGSMEPMTMVGGVQKELTENNFTREKSIFTGWNTEADGSGTTYTDRQAVKNITSENGANVILYAQWLTNDNAASPTQGQIDVTLKGGQTVVIPDLPAGTTYKIEEIDVPEGWTMEETDNGEGVIVSNKISRGGVTNAYTAEGEIALQAHKAMDNGAVKDGQFSFALKDPDGNVIDVKTNGVTDMAQTISVNENDEANPWYGTAPVDFDPLHFTQDDIGKTYTYTICETDMDDDEVIYDEHEEAVNISIEDAGSGVLLVTAEYDDDGALFVNSMKTGTLTVEKALQDTPDRMKDTEFEFRLNVHDQNGNELTGPFTVDKYSLSSLEEGPTSYVTAHSPNLDDMGNQDGFYDGYITDNGSYVYGVLTLPGEDSVHVDVSYSGANNYAPGFMFFKGDVTGNFTSDWYWPYQNKSSAYKAYEYGMPDGIRTDSFDMEGNTLTYVYYTSYYGPDDTYGYGYYIKMTPGDGGIEPEETLDISGGETFTLTAGQKAIIKGLPLGSVYTVEELPRANWEQVSAVGDTGNITSEGSQAAFVNSYGSELIGSAVIEADKAFVNGDLSSETFTFVLEENGQELGRKMADSNGHVRFDELLYTADQTGTYHYTIREVADGSRPYISFDDHAEEVTVTIEDNGGAALDVNVSYDGDGANFTNTHDKSLKFIKKGYDDSILSGAVIKVTADRDLSRVQVTGADDVSVSAGEVSFKTRGTEVNITGLPAGSITFAETGVPAGYVLADPITINDPNTEKVVMTDGLEEHEITISKRGPAGGSLAGAVLEVTGQTIEGDEIEAIRWTSTQDAPKVLSLLPGSYTLHEVSVPDPAIYLPANDIAFTVEMDGTVKVGGRAADAVVMTDYKKPVMDTLLHDAEGAKTGRPGRGFVLKDTVTMENLEAYIGQTLTIKGELHDTQTGELVSTVTDSLLVTEGNAASVVKDVTFTIDASEMGNRALVCYEYLLSGSQTIAKHEDPADEDQKFAFDWSVTIVKKDTDSGEVLPGAVFGIYSPVQADQKDSGDYPQAVSFEGTDYYFVYADTTGADGKLALYGARDTMLVYELQAPEDHDLPEQPGFLVTRAADHGGQKEVFNKESIWDFTVKKVASDDGSALNGARFAIYSLDQAEKTDTPDADASMTAFHDLKTWYLVDVKETAGGGLAGFEGLRSDKYLLKEVKAPAGYYAGDDSTRIVTRDENKGQTIEIQNIPGSELPETGGSGSWHIYMLSVMFIAAAIMFYKKRHI